MARTAPMTPPAPAQPEQPTLEDAFVRAQEATSRAEREVQRREEERRALRAQYQAAATAGDGPEMLRLLTQYRDLTVQLRAATIGYLGARRDETAAALAVQQATLEALGAEERAALAAEEAAKRPPWTQEEWVNLQGRTDGETLRQRGEALTHRRAVQERSLRTMREIERLERHLAHDKEALARGVEEALQHLDPPPTLAWGR